MTWAPNVPTEEEIEGFVEDLMAVTPEVLGIDETVPGCEVISMDPYGVGVGTLPRYIKVAIREYYQDAFYRGGIPGLSVGDFVSVTHFREGNRYEVTGAGGSGGSVLTLPAPGGQGWAMVSDAIPWWVASLTPTWAGEHSFGAGIAFTGASGTNEITIPDNTAIALELLDAGGLEHLRIVSTNVNPYFLIDPAGAGIDVGISTPTPEGKLDVAYGGNVGRMTLLLGADVAASTRTNVTMKRTLLGAYHYTNAEEPVGMMYAFSSNILNRLDIGGGTIYFNAATQVSIYTAANTTTQTGTERLKVDSAGAITVTGPSLTVPAAWNLIVPDNVANAIRLIDNGAADIFLQIVTTTGSEEVIFNAGADDVDFTVQAVGVADALQVRGSDGQITLGALTAGFVKSSAGGVLSVALEVTLAELAGYVRGSIIRGGAADWEALVHPGAAGYALISDATDIVWDQTPLWSGAHTHAADIILDDGVGDSPQLQLIGGSNNDTVLVYLDDDAVAGDSDLVIRLCAMDDGSRLIIQDNSPATVAYIDSDGNADFIGRVDVGNAAGAMGTNIIFRTRGTVTTVAGAEYCGNMIANFNPTGNFSGSVFGNLCRVEVGTAHARTGGTLYGYRGEVIVTNGIAATNLYVVGVHGRIDVEDATATVATALQATTPAVDTGMITTGYGLRIVQGAVGAGSITTLYGLNIVNITAGNTNYSIYTGTGLVHFGDQVEIIGSAAADVQLIVKGAAAQSASLVQYQDSAGNIFFDSGDGLVNSEVVWNEQGLDIDFRVEAVGQLNALFVQGSDGYTGFGTPTPDNPIHGFLETAIGSADITQYPLKIEAKDEGGDFWTRQGVGIQLENTASSGAFISAEIIGRVTATTGTEGDLVIKTRRSGTLTDALIAYNTGIVKIPNLAGVGVRNVSADANGNLIIS